MVMRYLFLILIMACDPVKQIDPKVGDCVIGTGMNVWKLIRMEKNKYLFAIYPVQAGSAIKIVEDVSTFKKVDCPLW